MKYSYKVYFEDGTTKLIGDQRLVDKELDSYDRFVLNGNLEEMMPKALNALNIKTPIKKTTILGRTENKKEFEYNLLNDNPYFDDIFYYVKDSKDSRNKERIIDSESENLKEMRDYLFKQLKEDPDNFITNIYCFHNKFREILNKYAIAYKSNNYTEEDMHNLYELESTIRKQLSVYKIYRTLASRRYYYEKTLINKVEEAKVVDVEEDEHEYSALTNEYNKKYDEYLEPEEYEQMANDSGSKVR